MANPVAYPERIRELSIRKYVTDMRGFRPARGNGYLGDAAPDGITTVDDVPASVTVRILYRPQSGAQGDGVVVAEMLSAPDGTWRVDGLNPSLKYDIVVRRAGCNDVIQSNVTPRT